MKDYRNHAVATHFGQVMVRLPSFRCAGCGAMRLALVGHIALPLDGGIRQASSAFFGLMPYRVAADLLKQVFPVDAGKDPETLRRHTLKIGEALRVDDVTRPKMAVAAVAVTLDSTFIRSC